MSKKTKTASSEARAKAKRAKKAANKARYAAMRDAGQNSKSYRAKRNAAGQKKIRVFRNRKRSKRMSDVKMVPRTILDINKIMDWQPINMSWRMAHNQVTVHNRQIKQGSPRDYSVTKKQARRYQRRLNRNAKVS